MNYSIFLIILGFIKFVFSNNTKEDSCPISALSYLRQKRAYTEYTRWRANAETTQEFIVKILEDDLTTPLHEEPVVAVNIQPYVKAKDKIIVDGVVVSTTNTENNIDAYRNYQRFEPPTTPASKRVSGNIIFAPVKSIAKALSPVRPKGIEIKSPQHSQRDGSLSLNPQVPRSQKLIAQYAPIAPVSFTRRDTVGPLTPRTVDSFILHTTPFRPTRTHAYPDVLTPRRTSISTDFVPYEYNWKLSNKLDIVNKTLSSTVNLYQTSIKTFVPTTSISDEPCSEEENRKSMLKTIGLEKDSSDKESNLSYNELFYNDGDSESSTKKGEDRTSTDYVDVAHNDTDTDNSNINYEDDVTDIDNATESSATLLHSTPILTSEITTDEQSPRNMTKIRRNFLCNILKIHPLTFNSARTLHEINTQLKKWSESSPIAKRLDITNGNFTVMENPIYMMMVDDPTSGQIVSAKLTVMIVAGIQGSDHHAVTAAMYLLYQLIERSDAHSDLLTKYRFWIIPVFNPDGYDYSITFPHRHEWSKNLRQSWDSCKGRDSCEACEQFGIRCTIQPCYGVNLDRNFEYQWIPPEELRSEHPCGSLYAGLRQLSEAETRALTQFLHELRSPLYTFIAFKEGDVLGILYPYSHTKKRRALDNIYRQRALRAAAAAYSISGRPYVAGQTSEFLPLYAGGIEDWVDGHLGIENTYTVMMFRPTDVRNSKIVTERVVHEAYAAVDTLLFQSVEPMGQPQITLTRAGAYRSSVNIKLAYLCLSVIYAQKL